MAGSVEHAQAALTEKHVEPIGGGHDALGWDGHEQSVEFVGALGAIHGDRPLPQPGRVDHVPQSTRMHQQSGRGQGAHEAACATGVIEMNVGQYDPVHIFRRDTQRSERSQHAGHGIVGPGIHDRSTITLDDDMDRCQQGAAVTGLKRVDAVRVADKFVHESPLLLLRFRVRMPIFNPGPEIHPDAHDPGAPLSFCKPRLPPSPGNRQNGMSSSKSPKPDEDCSGWDWGRGALGAGRAAAAAGA